MTGKCLLKNALSAAALSLLLLCGNSAAQNYKPSPNDTLQSVEILKDGRVTFRIFAPKASEVKLGGSDIPQAQQSAKMTKLDNGVWEVTLGPVATGAYRYNFVVDDVTVLDPKNPAVSQSNMNSWSLFHIPGSEFMDIKDVPHGTVSEVTYFSNSLKKFRRMHVYTPAGYEAGSSKYPVFYLLHGAWDCDDSWTTVGRAGFILDNLIAGKKAEPMIVVMPAGHTGPFPAPRPAAGITEKRTDEFVEDFTNDIRPYIEKNYRVLTGRADRAIAGLSMGGAQTINIAIPSLQDYSAIGVFSSGIFELRNQAQQNNNSGPSWEEKNSKILGDKSLKQGLDLFWFATGKEDFLLQTTKNTVELFKKHGFDPVYVETEGGHTWSNWREYLNVFAPKLFKSKKIN